MMKTKQGIYLLAGLLVVFGIFFAIRALHTRQPEYKTFKSNVAFQYPKSWNVRTGCQLARPFIATNTVVKGDFKNSSDTKLILHGKMSTPLKTECANNNVKLVVNTKNECREVASDRYLKNGTYIALDVLNNNGLSGAPVNPNRVTSISVLDKCGRILFDFTFVKNNGEKVTSSDDLLRYQEPGVDKKTLIGSDVYKEIVKFAESLQLDQ